MSENTGSFTLPGEAGYEELTLRLAKRWGADVIRDSDGTKLSDEIVSAGYGIYSTVCIIRDHNAWAREHMDMLQQTFLMTPPAMSDESSRHGRTWDGRLTVSLLEAFFEGQFTVNDSEESLRYWQVFDRTADQEICREDWTYCRDSGTVIIRNVHPYHAYTVNFLAYRIWEEISMYNHVTNGWDKDHLMPVDPRSGEAQEYFYGWLRQWCEDNPDTTVVRFTSLFYNFVWIWGADARKRNLFTDWGSYDFTVSPQAFSEFEEEYGYALTSEDFINKGRFHAAHMEPTKRQLDYIAFTNQFVVRFGKKLVELVHSYKKHAYLFFDDSWVGTEPYLPSFQEFGFDGIIKCIFSGYEVRLCAGVDVPVHEVRLHPYLFPVGLGGAPTFSEGGNPGRDARRYWNNARRALLRCRIDRIGLGGYLHLVEQYPDFVEFIGQAAEEFRSLKSLHEQGKAARIGLRVAVLTAWGKMRSWTLSGHFHETYRHDLIHVNEALAGLPIDVDYLCFDDVASGKLRDYDVVINAGAAKSAWSGGSRWSDLAVVEALTGWVADGGTLIGINQPSMDGEGISSFRLVQVLGVDQDTGAWSCHGRYLYEKDKELEKILKKGINGELHSCCPVEGIYLTDSETRVVSDIVEKNPIGEDICTPTLTIHDLGKGKGIYLSHFSYSLQDARLLLNMMLYGSGMNTDQELLTDNAWCECAYFCESRTLVVMNLSEELQKTTVCVNGTRHSFSLKPGELILKPEV